MIGNREKQKKEKKWNTSREGKRKKQRGMTRKGERGEVWRPQIREWREVKTYSPNYV